VKNYITRFANSSILRTACGVGGLSHRGSNADIGAKMGEYKCTTLDVSNKCLIPQRRSQSFGYFTAEDSFVLLTKVDERSDILGLD